MYPVLISSLLLKRQRQITLPPPNHLSKVQFFFHISRSTPKSFLGFAFCKGGFLQDMIGFLRITPSYHTMKEETPIKVHNHNSHVYLNQRMPMSYSIIQEKKTPTYFLGSAWSVTLTKEKQVLLDVFHCTQVGKKR